MLVQYDKDSFETWSTAAGYGELYVRPFNQEIMVLTNQKRGNILNE